MIELRRVLQTIRSAHCTITIDTKNAVWQVNSNVLRFICNIHIIYYCIYPFLTVAVGKIIDSLRIPLLSDAEQIQGQKSVFSHDDKVDEEAGCGLDHADLTVRHRNKPRRR
ncbi:hypothetical protein X777_09890 [Ooceraea biroi]|uniref:Uncharacterized protein n=1 Tax=Ooceraea biroi TaxID=2015173 RepID=A0A026W5D6_OOCBI|nr:hypothetical protein X777_09890 [Ooceraea biroi]